MRSEKYRLQTVLEIRRRSKDEAAKVVASNLQKLEQSESELSRRQKNLQACFEKQNQSISLMNNELNKGLQAQSILQHRNYLDDLRRVEIQLKDEVEQQRKVVLKAERDLEKAREKLMESARELKAIEIHKENWQETERSEMNRKEQKNSDEIGAILHERRKTSSK